MELHEGIALIRHDLAKAGAQRWADLGCGAGFFTEALAHLLPAASEIYAVDKSATLRRGLTVPNQIALHPVRADFVSDPLPFAALDGLLMANSLHYVREQATFLAHVQRYLKASHSLLIVEYDIERANPWVPYPLSFRALERLFAQVGYTQIDKLHERASTRGFDKMYGALIRKSQADT